jgi:predicted XRE-type DNA-binding protein
MKEEISQQDKEIARGVREWLREKQVSPKELAKRLGWTQSRVQNQIEGLVHWTHNPKVKFVISLGLMDGRAEDKIGNSTWERVESLPDEELDSLLQRVLPYSYRF